VVDDERPLRKRGRLRILLDRSLLRGQARPRKRQANNNLATLAGAVAERLYRPAMERHKTARERKADAHTAAQLGLRRLIGLNEELEDPRQHVTGDADAIVANAHDGAPVPLNARNVDLSGFRREFCRVGDEIAEDLRETDGIAINGQRLR